MACGIHRSEKTDPDQFDMALEDLETAIAAINAEDEADAPLGNRVARRRGHRTGRLWYLQIIEAMHILPQSFVFQATS
ncbi:hypothetical protein GR210_12195 [Rhizobium leguminosarum]|nr:hypothetical protein [Rhizobium leguminosarum]NEH57901.1 hypothetical protein [Rhizobium leguminosarum]